MSRLSFVRHGASNLPLAEKERMRLQINDTTYLEVYVDGDSFIVRCNDGRIAVLPHVANVIEIKVVHNG